MKLKVLYLILIFSLVMAHTALAKEREWKEYKKRHFIIYYEDAPLDFVKNVEETAEQSYLDIATNLGFTRYKGWNWEDRAKIYIFNDSEDYVGAAQAARWSHGVASPKDKVIRTFPSAHGFFDSTLPHELGHIIFREFIGFRARVPLWFEEGIAMYQEKAQRWGAHSAVQKAIENENFIPLDDLSKVRLYHNSSDDLVQLFYAESASIVYYMIKELGKSRFVRFCQELDKGKSFEEALKSVYVRFRDVNALNNAWQKYLKK